MWKDAPSMDEMGAVRPKAATELSLGVENRRAGKAKLIFVYVTDLALLLKHSSVTIN